jgi:hypothetical protein
MISTLSIDWKHVALFCADATSALWRGSQKEIEKEKERKSLFHRLVLHEARWSTHADRGTSVASHEAIMSRQKTGAPG